MLGAIVSPTDPLAATEIGRRLGVPRRPLAIIEGESLVNDGTALVLFKFAVAAVVTGTFSLLDASLLFVWTVLGGIAIGLVVGHLIRLLRRRVDNPPLEVMIAFLTGYFAFLPASALGASGVLAVVTAGVYMGWHTPELTTVETRLQGRAFWSIFTFLMNALLFGLVGLQLQPILDRLSGYTSSQLIGYAVAVAGVVIATRIVWVIPLTYLPRLLFPSMRRRDPYPPWQQPAFVCWTGMRGAVTLAAALAIPLATDAGTPFEARDLMVFLAFSVVLATLVLQGLSMPLVIRALGLEDDGLDVEGGGEGAHPRGRGRDRASRGARSTTAPFSPTPPSGCAARTSSGSGVSARGSTTATTATIEERSLQYQRARRELLEPNAARSSPSATRGGSRTRSCTASSATSTSKTRG